MAQAKWNLYLIKKGTPPFCHFQGLSDREAQEWLISTANKAIETSDGFVMLRSDYPMPVVWPGERG